MLQGIMETLGMFENYPRRQDGIEIENSENGGSSEGEVSLQEIVLALLSLATSRTHSHLLVDTAFSTLVTLSEREDIAE